MKKHSKRTVKRPVKKSKAVKSRGSKTLLATELLRELKNMIAVYKKEEMRDVSTRIDPDTADELLEKLEKIAKSL